MFALRVSDETGKVILDSSDFTYEVIFNDVLDWRNTTGDAEVTYNISGFDPSTCVFCVFLEDPGNYNPTTGYGYPPLPYMTIVNGTQIKLKRMTPFNTSFKSYATGYYRLMAFRML